MGIRNMTIEDYEQAVQLWQATEGIGLHEYEDSKAGIAHYLARNRGLSLIWRESRQVVGTLLCGHDGRRGYLHHLAVAAAHRGRGIGTQLVEHALHNLAQKGIRKCNIYSYADNEAGLAFWGRLGWQQREDIRIVSRDISLIGEHFVRVQIR